MKKVCENCVGQFVCCDQAMKPIGNEKTETCGNWEAYDNLKGSKK